MAESAVVCTCLVFLVLALAPAEGSHRDFKSHHHAKGKGFRAQLFPLVDTGVTFAESLAGLLKRSHDRARSFGDVITAQNQFDYQSPTTSVPGGYAMSITLGTPRKKLTAIADTGSDLVWVQCSPCSTCFSQPDGLFDPSKSSSYKNLTCSNSFCQDLPKTSCATTSSSATCEYNYRYGDMSQTNGDLAVETISITRTSGSLQSVPNFVFGCGLNNTGGFQQVDGLVGLGRGPVSFTSQLGSQFGNKFSYCLNTFGNPLTSPQQTSPIIFGESAVPNGHVLYTPFLNNSFHPTFYYVNLQGISVDNQKLDIPPSTFAINSTGQGGILFDSGTTITYLVAKAYQPLLLALKAAIKYPVTQSPQPDILELCYDTSSTQTPTFPTITFHFQGADYALSSQNAFIGADIFGYTQCLAIASSNFPLSIFGNVQQGNYHILYDRQNSRLGFVSAQCSSV